MLFTLMYQNNPVLEVNMNKHCIFTSIEKIQDERYLPVCFLNANFVTITSLNQWWIKRMVPDSRLYLKQTLDSIGISKEELFIKNLGIGVTDHYWLNPKSHPRNWEDINYFDKDYEKNVGDSFLFPDSILSLYSSFLSPDIVTNGMLPKRWIKIDTDNYLIKSGYPPYYQEPINEVIVSEILQKYTNVPSVKYALYPLKDKPFSICKNFITKETEFIPASDIYAKKIKPDEISPKAHLLEICEELEIPKVEEFISNMIAADYLIMNEDRHMGNFGFLRDTKTLKYIGPAPLFDHGNCLWHKDSLPHIGFDKKCKPFYPSHEQQIKNTKVTLDFSLLRKSVEELSGLRTFSNLILDERIEKIISQYEKRITSLEKIQSKQKHISYEISR